MKINHIILSALAILAVSCGTRKAEQFQALPFPDVAPPGMLETVQDRAAYMVEHWWDRITEEDRAYPCDTVLVSGVSKDVVEQKFANWVDVMSIVDYPTASKAVVRLYDRAVKCERRDTSSISKATATTTLQEFTLWTFFRSLRRSETSSSMSLRLL